MNVLRAILVIHLLAIVTMERPAAAADRPGSFLTSLLKKPEPPLPPQAAGGNSVPNPMLAQRGEPARTATVGTGAAVGKGVTVVAGVNPQQMEAMNQATQAHVERQLGAIQQRLKAAEQRLQAQLARIATQRQAAVQTGNQAALQKIEAAQSATVKSYEAEINRILNTSVSSPTPSQGAMIGNPPRRGFSRPSSQAAAKTNEPRDEPEPRRRFKFWPFR